MLKLLLLITLILNAKSFRLNLRNPYRDCNYLNALFINLMYCLLVLPSILVRENGTICK